ncbi:MAG TPA: sulfate adenylyltransferase subunit CysN [Candidatus Sulfopaludibacter sp.]|jgi:sulfate adenylyltransferase large subunit|nr:sulfate adenylyltransferase subunit CysN [Candidatus Sulfopaludibacter sp.]
MDLLRFTTAGSVDDGKSTLIGRLLYDSKTVYEDQLASVRKATTNRTTKGLDLSLLTDGLRAEREQGITIDVAYRYFSTPRRKFIIADTPGHEQYTRNMATGASTANLAIILIDARYGVLPQSRRHAYIASLLAIPHVVVAINKMDLVDFREDVFLQIRDQFQAFARQMRIPDVRFIPLSALDGDNVVKPSARMDWYDGPSLLDHLETVPLVRDHNLAELRFPVQYVIRPDLDFRGFAGQIASGVIRRGDTVRVLPSGKTSRVKSLVTFDGPLEEAFAPMAVTVCLEDEIDVSRGDMIVHPDALPLVTRRFEANLVWMSEKPLDLHRALLLKHTKQTVQARVRAIRHRTDVNSLEQLPATQLQLNEIGFVAIECQKALFCDPYARNRQTGAFILIDPISNDTVAAGMISGSPAEFPAGPVTPEERLARIGHKSCLLLLPDADSAVAAEVERHLFDRGYLVHRTGRMQAGVAAAEAGLIGLIFGPGAREEVASDLDCLRLEGNKAARILDHLPAPLGA